MMELSADDDNALALPWLSEREPSMLLPEALPPSDAFDGLLNQWLMSAVRPDENDRGPMALEAPQDLPSLTHALPGGTTDPWPLGGGSELAHASSGNYLDPYGSRLSALLDPTGAANHLAKNSWEQIPLFDPNFATNRTGPTAGSGSPGQDPYSRDTSNSPFSNASSLPPIISLPEQQQQQQQSLRPQRSSGSGTSSGGEGKWLSGPSFSASMVRGAVSSAQWPITSLASSLGEGSKALLTAPVEIAKTGARMGSGLVMGAFDGGFDGAKRAWRRRNQSEESRQKERARNRRAQKRFREKQKARQLERKDTVMELRSQLNALATEKTALASRNAILEKVFSMRAHVDATLGEHGSMDQSAVDFTDVFSGEDTPNSITITMRSGPVELSRDQLTSLAWSDHVAIWKDHVDALAAELESTKHSGEEVTDRLLELIQECSTLSLCLCVLNPLAMLRFQMTRLDQPVLPDPKGGPSLPPGPTPSPRSHWQYIEAAIALDEHQATRCFESRRMFLTQLGQILRQRAELHALATRTCRAMGLDRVSPLAGGVAEESQGLLEAMETLQKLQRNLREEQKLIVQRMIVNHQCSLRPRQAALKMVLSWPWYPDTLAIIEASAARAGTEPKTSTLLGLDQIVAVA